MSNVIAIGQAALALNYKGGNVTPYVGGRIANMAASLGVAGLDVDYVSECGNDAIGDVIVDFFKKNNVETKSIDRFIDGQSQMTLHFFNENGEEKVSDYVNYPKTRFNVLWPTINKNDIVVFGSFFALDESVHQQLIELLTFARERKAIIVYLPGFNPRLCSRITRVMPAILENLELSDIVIAREMDMENIFNVKTAQEAYDKHISFYCKNFVFVNRNFDVSMHLNNQCISYTNNSQEHPIGWNAAFCAGLIYGISSQNITLDDLKEGTNLDKASKFALDFANKGLSNHSNVVSKEFINSLKF